MSTLMDNSIMTVEEVADYLRLSTKTIRRMIQQKELPSLRVGGSIRIARLDLETYMEGLRGNAD